MIEFEFELKGGLGNQIFQYLASKYISRNFKNLKISYIVKKYNITNINHLIKEEIIYKKNLKENYLNKIYIKSVNEILKLCKNEHNIIKKRLLLTNQIWESDFKNSNLIYDPVKTLTKILENNLIKISNKKILINGFWQNPSLYLNDIHYYKSLFIDTAEYLPEFIKPNNYICMHIRRGDYLKDNFMMRIFFSKYSPINQLFISKTFLKKEFKTLPFIIITDDMEYVNSLKESISDYFENQIKIICSQKDVIDWSIMRHSSISLVGNSTFSYTAALLNNENNKRKIKCIVPQWINSNITSYEKGWITPRGFIDF